MSWLQVVVLSVLQGLTEFLPVSSSGHLAIASRIFFDDDAGASFTAVTQLGTELAVLLYFARDIGASSRRGSSAFSSLRTAPRLLAGLVGHHRHHPDRRVGPAVQGRNPYGTRNLWMIASALIIFSAVIAAAEYYGKQTRPSNS